MGNLFNNIGGKIKMLAQITCWIGIVGSIIAGIVLLVEDGGYGELIVPGILVAVGGSLLSWCGSFVLYGFGELIENTSEIAQNTRGGERKSEMQERFKTERNFKDTSYGENEGLKKEYQTLPANASYLCECGLRFYGETCPNCGRKKNTVNV